MARNKEFVNLLIEKGADLNAENKFGMNVLHMSFFAFDTNKDHSPSFEKSLIEQGTILNKQDNF
jgi:ankyrin repeat protein